MGSCKQKSRLIKHLYTWLLSAEGNFYAWAQAHTYIHIHVHIHTCTRTHVLFTFSTLLWKMCYLVNELQIWIIINVLSGVSDCIRLELNLPDSICSGTVHKAVHRAQGIQSLSETRQGFCQNFGIVSSHLLTTFENITFIFYLFFSVWTVCSVCGSALDWI